MTAVRFAHVAGFACFLLCAASARAAPTTLVYVGTLTNAAGPVNGPVTLVADVYDAVTDGSAVYTETFAAVEVVEGVFVVELGATAGAVLEEASLLAPRYLSLTINGEPLSPRTAVATVPGAHHTPHARVAELAERARAFGDLAAVDIAQRALLATPGGAPVAFANVTNLPAGMADGDDDARYTAGAGVAVSGDHVVSASALTSGMTSAATVTGADIADRSLTGAQVQGPLTEEMVAGDLVEVYLPNAACDLGDRYTLTSTCRPVATDCQIGFIRECAPSSGCRVLCSPARRTVPSSSVATGRLSTIP